MALYLTPAEQKLFQKLPAELRKGWKVTEETGTAWETDEQMAERVRYVRKELETKTQLNLQQMFIKFQTKGFEALGSDDFPPEALPYVLYLIGAVGLTKLIHDIIQHAESQDDWSALELCCSARHRLLHSNEVVSSLAL